MPKLNANKSASIWSVPFVLLMIINFFDTMCFQMLRTMMTQYATDLGMAMTQATVLASALSVASLIMRPIAGRLVDTKNNKKIMLATFAGMFLTMVLHFFAKSYALLLLARMLNGVFYGISSVVTITIAGSMLPEEKMGQGIGMFGMGLSVAITFSSMVGIWVYSFGAAALVAAAVFSMVVCFVLAIFVPDKPKKVAAQQKSIKETLRGLVAVEAIPIAILNFVFYLAFAVVGVFVVVYFNARNAEGVSIGNAGVFFMVWGLMLFVARPVAGKLYDKYGLVPIESLCIVCLGTFCVLISVSTSWTVSLISALIGSFGFGGSVPVLQAAAFSAAPPERKGAANSTNLMGGDLGNAVGGVFYGAIATWFVREGAPSFGYQMSFRVAGLLCVIAVVYLLILSRNPKYNRKKAKN